jgi:fructose-1,6-bisphosphatase/inositol monophosphatase family enzyme
VNEPPDGIDLPLLRAWLREAGWIALAGRRPADVRTKQDGSILTDVDIKIASFLERQISGRYPGHRVLCEDGRLRGGESDTLWVIDPLDGSRAFAAGLPLWGISIGVFLHDRPYLGAVSLPELGELYWGGPEGAFHNDERLHPPGGMGLDHPLASLLVPSNAHRLYDIGFPRVRSMGSTVVHLGYLAQGAALGVLTRRVRLWDLAGFLPILRETDMALVYLSGRPLEVERLLDGARAPEPLVAAPAHLVEAVRAMFQPRAGPPEPGTAGEAGHSGTPARGSS